MRRLAIVAASAVTTHLSALGAGMVWLDHAHIEGGAAIASPAGIPGLFTHGFAGTGYYRPLMALSLSLDALVGGAAIFHATSILWHAAAAVMTTVAGEALGLSRRAALIAGVVFAVHPISSLVADAIAFRSEAIITASLLALVWAHVRKRPVLAAGALAIGALTKESALVLGPLFIVALSLRQPRDRRVLGAEAAALIGALGLRLAYAPAWRASGASLAPGDAVGTRLAALSKSAASVLLPVHRSICDAFDVTHWWQPTALAGGVVLVALAVLAWRQRGIALLLALATLPALQLVPVMRWWSPHYLYLPFAFVAMYAGTLGERLGTHARGAIALGGAVIALLGGITLYDGLRYADDVALWTPEVKRQPACREGQFYLGEVERRAKRWEPAARRFDAALMPWPGVLAYVDRGAALQNLGTVRFEQGKFGDARRAYGAALEGTQDEHMRRELTHNLAGAVLAEGDPEEAVRLLEPETARPDAFPDSLVLHAMALRRLGRPGGEEEARRLLDRAGDRR